MERGYVRVIPSIKEIGHGQMQGTPVNPTIKHSTTWSWTWIDGKSVTIDKWHREGHNPDPDDSYGMIHKEYPKGFKGSLSTFRGTVRIGWICEEETGIDQH